MSSFWTVALNIVIPILGVLFFDWNLFAILYLFWIQLLAIGVTTCLGIIFSIAGNKWLISMITNIPYLLFFAVLYGGLLMLVMAFSLVNLDLNDAISGKTNSHLGIAMITILASSGIDFLRDFFFSGYFKKSHPSAEIFLTFIGALPLALVLLFLVIPITKKFDAVTANKILIIGIIILKGFIEYYIISARHVLYATVLKAK